MAPTDRRQLERIEDLLGSIEQTLKRHIADKRTRFDLANDLDEVKRWLEDLKRSQP